MEVAATTQVLGGIWNEDDCWYPSGRRVRDASSCSGGPIHWLIMHTNMQIANDSLVASHVVPCLDCEAYVIPHHLHLLLQQG